MPKPTAKPKGSTPAAATRGQMTARLVAMGYTGPALANIIKAGRTRGQMADDLIALQRSAPKG